MNPRNHQGRERWLTDFLHLFIWPIQSSKASLYSNILYISPGKPKSPSWATPLMMPDCATCICPIKSCVISAQLPAIMSSTVLILSSTCWMRPTSVLVCRLRTLLRRMAVNMLQISAWHVTSQWDSRSTMQPMLSASWMMKFISRSNSPPTSYGEVRKRRGRGGGAWFKSMGSWAMSKRKVVG